MKKITKTKQKLVLGRETVKALIELSADRLRGIQAGQPFSCQRDECQQCSDPESGCGTVSQP